MKLAEKILSDHTGEEGIYLTKGMIRGSDALDAMEEYAKQARIDEVTKLRNQSYTYIYLDSFRKQIININLLFMLK